MLYFNEIDSYRIYTKIVCMWRAQHLHPCRVPWALVHGGQIDGADKIAAPDCINQFWAKFPSEALKWGVWWESFSKNATAILRKGKQCLYIPCNKGDRREDVIRGLKKRQGLLESKQDGDSIRNFSNKIQIFKIVVA